MINYQEGAESKLYQKAKKTATKIKKKVYTTAKRIQKATVSFVKKVVAGTLAAVAIAGAVALTGGAAMQVLIGAAQAGGMEALEQELCIREENARKRLIRRACFPAVKSFTGYDYSHVTIPPAMPRAELEAVTFISNR